jgi:protein arginine kinase activator
MMMICEHCQLRQAHVHITQTTNGQTVDKHLCESCAVALKTQGSPFSFSVHGFLKDIYDEKFDPQKQSPGSSAKICSTCGQTYENYKETGLFGCPDCYRSFRLIILPLVKRIQGNLQHTGKIPVKLERAHRFEKKKQQLQASLKEAVRSEAYENAVELRDQILLLDQKISQLKGEFHE